MKDVSQVDRERELISKVQMYDDKFAMNELVRMYRPVITKAIQTSGISSNMEWGTAEAEAINILKKTIKNKFDLSRTNKPITYLTEILVSELQKLKYANKGTISRKRDDLERISGYVGVASDFLEPELGRAPTSSELYHFIRNDMKKGGRGLSIKDIEDVQKQTRKEYSGDRILNDELGAAKITTFDVMSDTGPSADRIFQDEIKKKSLESVLDNSPDFSRTERKFLRMMYSLGEYSDKKPPNLRQGSLNSNMTYYQGQQTLKKFADKLVSLGYDK